MIQLVQQRKRYEGATPVFVYTDPVILIPDLVTLLQKHAQILKENIEEDEQYDLFYTVAHHTIAPGSKIPQRNKTTFAYQTIIPFDIDDADIARPLEYGAVIGEVMQAPLEAVTVIVSGGGIHALLSLKDPIRSIEHFEKHRQDYRAICEKIDEALKEAHLPGHADPVVFEPARVLRMPGTKNTKRNEACRLIQLKVASLNYDLHELSGYKQMEKENVSPQEVRRNYPVPDFKEIIHECRFLKSAIDDPKSIHEPQAFDALSLLAMMPIDATSIVKEKPMNPKEVGEYIFDGASQSESLKRATFEDKWAQAKKYGGRKCTTIQSHWIGGCETCPHYGKIPTPLALKSPAHIGSAGNGFWVYNKKGAPLHPNYQDLASVYRSETSYVVIGGERIMRFADGFYSEILPLNVKGWMERKVSPTEPLRENHRNEFLYKMKAMGELMPDQEEHLFADSLRGKINCSNGVLDTTTGQLLPQSSEYGFKYILPHAYQPDQSSEFFLDWLATVTNDRVELMESIQDLMAYCLWPNYDDHLFAYFVGEGANGKSTLLEVIRELLGPMNCSAVSLNQLTRNRFAPASLEGKLANISGESSEREISVSEINQLKELSAGERTQVERKGQDPFDLINRAKLIFSANKTPRFEENGHALKRRMLVIPFDHTIKNPDSRVGARLIAEIPAILSMLVARIQKNTLANGGRFLVYRGGEEAKEAQTKVLTQGNTVIEWAKECVESSIHVPHFDYVTADAAYIHYLDWCQRNGIRSTKNKISFSRDMVSFVVTNACEEKQVRIYLNGKTVRGYRRTRFKTESTEQEEVTL